MRVFVTGSSGGLGGALVEKLLANQHCVIGIDCSEPSDACNSFGHANFQFISADLRSISDINSVVDEIALSGPLDVILHVAGVNATGRFDRIDASVLRDLVAINLRAPIILTSILLRKNLIANGGTVGFVGSLSSLLSYPGASVYAASKDGLLSFSRSLALELSPLGINCVTVLPGPLRTEHANRHAPPAATEKGRLEPDEAASLILEGLSQRSSVIVPGLRARAIALFAKLMPGLAERAMRRLLYLPLARD